VTKSGPLIQKERAMGSPRLDWATGPPQPCRGAVALESRPADLLETGRGRR
jgi:hypothetical protein